VRDRDLLDQRVLLQFNCPCVASTACVVVGGLPNGSIGWSRLPA